MALRPSANEAEHIPRSRESCGYYALSPVGGGGCWALLLLSLLLSVGAQDLGQSAATVLLPFATAATLQGMARVLSGQAPAYHLSAMLGYGKGHGDDNNAHFIVSR
jgi:hypothetical protein